MPYRVAGVRYKVILIKPNDNGRSIAQCRSSNTISIKTEMPIGRYFFEEKFEEGYIFKLKN